jgi:hypothetical protein
MREEDSGTISLRKPISGDIEGMIVLESASLVESDC